MSKCVEIVERHLLKLVNEKFQLTNLIIFCSDPKNPGVIPRFFTVTEKQYEANFHQKNFQLNFVQMETSGAVDDVTPSYLEFVGCSAKLFTPTPSDH